MKMIKGLIFDLDGVITDTAKYHFLAWQSLAEELGITIDLIFNEKLKGIDRMTSLEMILAEGAQENNFNVIEKKALASKKNKQYCELLQQLGPDDLLPGILRFLEEVTEAGIPCAIASASKNAPYILKQLQVSQYFTIVVDPESVANGKPAPDIFLKGLEALGIKAEEAVAFEDAQAGVTAINAAGILGVGITSGEPLTGTAFNVPDFSQMTLEKLQELKNT